MITISIVIGICLLIMGFCTGMIVAGFALR